MKIELLSIAKQELEDASAYYNSQQKGLGSRYKSEVKSTLKRISIFPTAYMEVKSEIRRCVMHTFPYSIYYSIQDNKIVVLAISHHHRKPDYWV
jgi:plasmid stabilization system protein ParE